MASLLDTLNEISIDGQAAAQNPPLGREVSASRQHLESKRALALAEEARSKFAAVTNFASRPAAPRVGTLEHLVSDHNQNVQALSDKNQRAGKSKGRATSKKANARAKKKRSGGEAYAERHKSKVGGKVARKGKQASAKRMY
mmetsp:Transcript_31932/g.54953  ORF Transcript_31932/g.54953 Transcript_31932/m.54953 type:complete len:142 (+) Transcript_31932:54-479(+)